MRGGVAVRLRVLRGKAASAITADRSSEKRTRSFGACRLHMPSWAPKRRTSAPGTALARPLTRRIEPPLATKAGSLPQPSRSAVRAARYAGPSVAGSNPGPVSPGATVSGIPNGRKDSRWVTRRSRASLGSRSEWKRRFSRSTRRPWASCTGSGGKPGKATDGMAVNRSRSATRPSISASTRVLRSSPRSMVQPLRSMRLLGPRDHGRRRVARLGNGGRAGLSPSGRPSAGPRSHPTCRPEAWP